MEKNPGSGQKSYIHMSKNHLRSFGAFVQSVNAILILHIYNPHQNNDPPRSELGQNDRKKKAKKEPVRYFFFQKWPIYFDSTWKMLQNEPLFLDFQSPVHYQSQPLLIV